MRPCENVIVTIIFKNRNLDMELPTFSSIKELTDKLEETLDLMNAGYNRFGEKLILLCEGDKLPEDATLASCGIWDGSIISCDIRR